jgi:peptidoglycan/xylan/chitin deacetylase (PgdA/CDA1 family)
MRAALAGMEFDRAASLFLAHPMMRFGLLRTEPGIPVLMYHSISDDSEPGVSPYYRLTTSPARFREQMQWLRKLGYAVISLSEALRRLDGHTLGTEPCVVLTFDDGFRDFFTHAWPVLAEFESTATVFLPTAFIGHSRKTFKGRECLTWAEIRKLHGQGVSFGAHTVNHPRLHSLPWTEVGRELRDSRERIEGELQVAVNTFAYPYAFPQEDSDFVAGFRRELVQQGYKAAVTTVIGRLFPGSDRLCMKRLPVNDRDDRALFEGKLAGAYDWVGGLQGLFRRTRRHASVVDAT